MIRVCPKAWLWNKAYERLLTHASSHVCTPAAPPVPLILSTWVYSNDQDKMIQWTDTVAWAHANGCNQIVDQIPDEDFYYVSSLTTYVVGPLGGPMYRPWDFESKPTPSSDTINRYFEVLSSNWTQIVGADLGKVTRPIFFSGKTARRLLVQANPDIQPAWGNWQFLSNAEGERRAFTQFRAAINKAIEPHEVDHIDFATSTLATEKRTRLTHELVEKKLS
jgi:hypothetical protein